MSTIDERIARKERELEQAREALKLMRREKRQRDRAAARLREQKEALRVYRLLRDTTVRFRNGNTENALTWVERYVAENAVRDDDAQDA